DGLGHRVPVRARSRPRLSLSPRGLASHRARRRPLTQGPRSDARALATHRARFRPLWSSVGRAGPGFVAQSLTVQLLGLATQASAASPHALRLPKRTRTLGTLAMSST